MTPIPSLGGHPAVGFWCGRFVVVLRSPENVMRLIKCSSLISWTILKEYRELHPSEYFEWSEDVEILPAKTLFVSHRWITPEHPDPEGIQLRELQERLKLLAEQDKSHIHSVVFYDYSSMLQRPWTAEEDGVFYRDVASLRALILLANKVFILSEGYRDYKNRAWCFLEAIASEANLFFFDDQADIKDDLNFLGFLLSDILQITSFDFSYKPHGGEAQIITAVFQHLNACKVTHADDFALIKQQMLAHFNTRRLSSFGRLITALNKYFDVTFALGTLDGDDPILCKPFFAEPEWTRLPIPEVTSIVKASRPGGLFALPQTKYEELDLEKQLAHRCIPILRLSLPGVDNIVKFMEDFQNVADWKRYIVHPLMLSLRGDSFPSIDHVIHTILERPPGLACTRDSKYLILYLISLKNE